jgi:hypothetical protein
MCTTTVMKAVKLAEQKAKEATVAAPTDGNRDR